MHYRLAPRSVTLDHSDDLKLLYKFEFSVTFAGFRTFVRQQLLNEWRWTAIVSYIV